VWWLCCRHPSCTTLKRRLTHSRNLPSFPFQSVITCPTHPHPAATPQQASPHPLQPPTTPWHTPARPACPAAPVDVAAVSDAPPQRVDQLLQAARPAAQRGCNVLHEQEAAACSQVMAGGCRVGWQQVCVCLCACSCRHIKQMTL
jgi:hypothetical protein